MSHRIRRTHSHHYRVLLLQSIALPGEESQTLSIVKTQQNRILHIYVAKLPRNRLHTAHHEKSFPLKS